MKTLPQAHLKESNLLVKINFITITCILYPRELFLYTSSNSFMSFSDLFATLDDLKILRHTSDPVKHLTYKYQHHSMLLALVIVFPCFPCVNMMKNIFSAFFL